MNQLYPKYPGNIVANIAASIPIVLAISFLFYITY